MENKFVYVCNFLYATLAYIKKMDFMHELDLVLMQVIEKSIRLCFGGWLLFYQLVFVYHHWGSTTIYRPLSYPFQSLDCCNTVRLDTTIAAEP